MFFVTENVNDAQTFEVQQVPSLVPVPMWQLDVAHQFASLFVVLLKLQCREESRPTGEYPIRSEAYGYWVDLKEWPVGVPFGAPIMALLDVVAAIGGRPKKDSGVSEGSNEVATELRGLRKLLEKALLDDVGTPLLSRISTAVNDCDVSIREASER